MVACGTRTAQKQHLGQGALSTCMAIECVPHELLTSIWRCFCTTRFGPQLKSPHPNIYIIQSLRYFRRTCHQARLNQRHREAIRNAQYRFFDTHHDCHCAVSAFFVAVEGAAGLGLAVLLVDVDDRHQSISFYILYKQTTMITASQLQPQMKQTNHTHNQHYITRASTTTGSHTLHHHTHIQSTTHIPACFSVGVHFSLQLHLLELVCSESRKALECQCVRSAQQLIKELQSQQI